MRVYIFTELKVERLLAWLETSEEDDETRMLSRVRQNYPLLSVQLRLFLLAAKKLIVWGRWKPLPRIEEYLGPQLAKRMRRKAIKKRN
jgi:hypothetical protein